MKIFNLVCFVLFLLFAALQYNDPDPYLWIPFYLYPALLCLLAALKRFYPLLYIVGLVVYAAYAVYLFFDTTGVLNWVQEHNAENIVQSMQATKPWIEETREFGGLLVVIVVLSINLVHARKNKAVSLYNIH